MNVTIPQLAERIEVNKKAEEAEFASVKSEIKSLRDDFNSKFTRIYLLLGTAIASIIGGIVVQIVGR